MKQIKMWSTKTWRWIITIIRERSDTITLVNKQLTDSSAVRGGGRCARTALLSGSAERWQLEQFVGYVWWRRGGVTTV